jgi:hypothetical protein
MPVQLFGRGGHAAFALTASAVGAAVVLAFSSWEFSRRELE